MSAEADVLPTWYVEMVETWNEQISAEHPAWLPRIRVVNQRDRVKLAKERYKDAEFQEHWKEAMLRVLKSAWLRGDPGTRGDGHEGWKFDFDKFLSIEKKHVWWREIYEGKYDTKDKLEFNLWKK